MKMLMSSAATGMRSEVTLLLFFQCYLFREHFVGVGAGGAVVEVGVKGLSHNGVERLQALRVFFKG
jgi:hypothetical protein